LRRQQALLQTAWVFEKLCSTHMKKRFLSAILAFVLSLAAPAQLVVRLDGSQLPVAELNRKLERLVQAGRVTGLAIAIFNNNKPVYQKTFGYKNAETKEGIKPTTNFYGASLSKAVFAVLVLKLVEEGVLDLDKPLQQYLAKPIWAYAPQKKWHDNYSALKADSLYQKITARMCLAHTTGFPNWRWDEPDETLRIHGMPGTRYSYSGEGLVYLQVMLEKMLNTSLEELMQRYIFKPLGMQQSSYTWQPRFEGDYCLGHNTEGKPYEKDKDNEARSASTLETTLEDYTKFTTAILQHRLLKPATTKEMFSPQIRIRSVRQFGPLRLKDSTGNDAIGLSYGLGWVLLQSPHGVGAFKEGHGDGFQHYSILFPQAGTGIVILTNSDSGESIFKELLQTSIGDTYTPWQWEGYIPYNQKSIGP
jgi:CubicO group peptidase (beta-lactamase class C family)